MAEGFSLNAIRPDWGAVGARKRTSLHGAEDLQIGARAWLRSCAQCEQCAVEVNKAAYDAAHTSDTDVLRYFSISPSVSATSTFNCSKREISVAIKLRYSTTSATVIDVRLWE